MTIGAKRIIDITRKLYESLDALGPDDLQALGVKGMIDHAMVAHVGRLTGLRGLSLPAGESVDDEVLWLLERLDNLILLGLRGSKITDAAFSSIAKMRSLKVLSIAEIRGVSGTGLAALQGLPLKN